MLIIFASAFEVVVSSQILQTERVSLLLLKMFSYFNNAGFKNSPQLNKKRGSIKARYSLFNKFINPIIDGVMLVLVIDPLKFRFHKPLAFCCYYLRQLMFYCRNVLQHYEKFSINLWKQRKLNNKIQVWKFLRQLIPQPSQIRQNKVRHHLSHVPEEHRISYAVPRLRIDH